MDFDGHDDLNVTNGYLKLIVGGEDLVFPSAVAYQLDPGNNIVPLNWLPVFVKASPSTAKIQTGNYDPSLPLIIQLISGAVGGNVAGKLMKGSSLGTLGNSLAGILGGGLGGQVLGMLGMGGAAAAEASTGMDLSSILGSVAGGGVGGGIVMAVIGMIKKAMAK